MTTPPPPLQSFASDNTARAHPAVVDAIARANVGSAGPYGADPWTERATAQLRERFGAPDAEVLFTYGGTGANIVALQALLLPHQAVICAATAHINTDEGGAPERFTGAKLIDLPTPDGKLTPAMIEPLLRGGHGEHSVSPAVIAISQVTELGTVYSLPELTELAAFAHANGLVLFVDGARLGNAAATLNCTLQELTTDVGVDVLTFGGTKNGLLFGEAVVFLRPELAQRARFARKQAAQLPSKMRFVSAQFEALLAADLWIANARHANDMAARLAAGVADVPGVELLHAPQANSLFVRLDPEAITRLQDWSFFWSWSETDHTVRWMTSFATTTDDVDRFVEGVRQLA